MTPDPNHAKVIAYRSAMAKLVAAAVDFRAAAQLAADAAIAWDPKGDQSDACGDALAETLVEVLVSAATVAPGVAALLLDVASKIEKE